MQMALKKLAMFHAASAVYCEQNGPYNEKFSRGVYNADMKEIFDQHYDFNFSFILEEFISTWPNLDKRIVDKMVICTFSVFGFNAKPFFIQRMWRDYILDELIRSMAVKANEFNCLAHGDAWLANILLRHDSSGELVDCQFIDFQQSVYTSPAIDLINLIFTSAETETKLRNFEHFIKVYHEQLVDALQLLKYTKKIPTLKQLYMDVLDRGFLAVWNGIAVLPTCLIENVEESSSNNLLGEDEEGKTYKEKIFNNERYRKHMTELLTYFDMRGLVDLC